MKKTYLTEEEALNDLKSDKQVWANLSTELKDNKEFFLKLCDLVESSRLKNLLGFTSQRLRKDTNFVFKLACKNPLNLEWAAGSIIDDEEFAISLFDYQPLTFKEFSKRLRRKKDFSLIAIQKNPHNLQHVVDLSNDTEVVLRAVNQIGWCIKYASLKLRNNKDIALVAVKNHVWSLSWLSKRLKNNDEVVLEAVKNFGESLKYASKRLKNNENIALEAVKNNSSALEYCSKRLMSNYDLILEAVKKDGLTLAYASNKLKDNEQIVQAAIQNNPGAIKYA
jgi:hypothetical protein